MAGRIKDEDLESLKQRLDIVEVIQPYTALKRSGSNFMGRCPFHDEKSPSFSVRQDKGFYHCFGCGVGGDAIKFVQEADGLSFTESVEKLARQFGITLRYEELRPGQAKGAGTPHQDPRTDCGSRNVLPRAVARPDGEQARAYLLDRGVPESAWETFGIGWAPDAWGDLSDHLIAAGTSPQDIINAGLATRGRRGPVDRFRARVLFPIRDQRGDTVAFGGRIMPDGPVVTKMDGKAPKYINSPGTDIYNKSATLYGLDLARREIVKRREVLVVEGYMDVIALHLAGMPNTVAPCGTALTEDHFTLMQRLDAKVTLSLDADAAGFDAAERARERAEQAGIADLGVLVLPDGQDPADLVSAGGDRGGDCSPGRSQDRGGSSRSTTCFAARTCRRLSRRLPRIDQPSTCSARSRIRHCAITTSSTWLDRRSGFRPNGVEDELNRAHPIGSRQPRGFSRSPAGILGTGSQSGHADGARTAGAPGCPATSRRPATRLGDGH